VLIIDLSRKRRRAQRSRPSRRSPIICMADVKPSLPTTIRVPYGRWTCADGREVLFDRHYHPISQKLNGVISRADPSEVVTGIVRREFFYDDDTYHQRRERSLAALRRW
jgi:hypothetical protein